MNLVSILPGNERLGRSCHGVSKNSGQHTIGAAAYRTHRPTLCTCMRACEFLRWMGRDAKFLRRPSGLAVFPAVYELAA